MELKQATLKPKKRKAVCDVGANANDANAASIHSYRVPRGDELT